MPLLPLKPRKPEPSKEESVEDDESIDLDYLASLPPEHLLIRQIDAQIRLADNTVDIAESLEKISEMLDRVIRHFGITE